jgi:hypothetical protein
MIDEMRIVKDVQGSGRGLIAALSQNLLVGIQENHENPQSGYLVLRPRFEPGTSRIRT